ncbi:MarR family winged helix-turn-helix transcriptional regulator [Nocardia cyriacigeorgica]|uniref:MarR family winged helix-turn-helix transcriptional regulator n=2 Tax=Nocardia cyriacigeorgica TaxID=135487 RepID=UPI001894DA57|nr:MarR family transcriptional regulator [Nocardia cyriacigeorgica]MBF6454045.1 MarR family transcriptional regulator [Nocardia cyriacigeorgica]MBF6477757.1 MarR family transcriptional regulator [Nocardia cyriacigeorgica]MBF6551939.1 MarR family transcriptional regulator [Nocardia cyriacigeorgica]
MPDAPPFADDPAAPGRRLSAQELDALSHVPLISASFRRAHSDMPEALRATFQTHGLGPRHGAILTQLMAGEPASVTDLARRLGVSLSTASQLVGDLARADLVLREEDPRNRRRTLVSIAGAIRPIFEQFLAVRSAALLRAIARLEPTDRQAFLAGLAAWAQEEQKVTAPAVTTDRRTTAE